MTSEFVLRKATPSADPKLNSSPLTSKNISAL